MKTVQDKCLFCPHPGRVLHCSHPGEVQVAAQQVANGDCGHLGAGQEKASTQVTDTITAVHPGEQPPAARRTGASILQVEQGWEIEVDLRGKLKTTIMELTVLWEEGCDKAHKRKMSGSCSRGVQRFSSIVSVDNTY